MWMTFQSLNDGNKEPQFLLINSVTDTFSKVKESTCQLGFCYGVYAATGSTQLKLN